MLETNISYDPTSFDVLITDIGAQDLRKVISDELNVGYLSDSNQEHDGDVDGIIYGRGFRLICTLTVKIRAKIKFVHFIVNTSSPSTYLSDDALSAFGLTISNPDYFINARINNKDTVVLMSPPGSHFSGINLLGSEFLKFAGATLVAKYRDNCFTLKF
ncbi:hypothetical protein RhiirA5_378200 [Rhizophagus irregularis]|uniref:Uncharacterized protein n=1 Tax=Rhizophagus irregularis TaxID=588596 RepID=A0A2N0PGM4_9GLOM|nr:hypothetical protein RhiirA5_378200 [Rhizophagus irregularis]CAB5217270.1 unnamed protein product [Rhizophagus irregularis]CAB5381652.1 unnamed protein product [Rhizophagus irregularis]